MDMKDIERLENARENLIKARKNLLKKANNINNINNNYYIRAIEWVNNAIADIFEAQVIMYKCLDVEINEEIENQNISYSDKLSF